MSKSLGIAVILYVTPPVAPPFEYVVQKSPCTLGNSDRADVWVRDSAVGVEHLLIRIRDDHATVSDIDTGRDSFVNGNLFSTTVLRDGDQISIGRSKIFVRIEKVKRLSPLPPSAAPDTPLLNGEILFRFGDGIERQQTAEQSPFVGPPEDGNVVAGFKGRHSSEILKQKERLFGVIDAAQDVGFVAELKDRGYQLTSLFISEAAWQFVAVAPYFFVANAGSKALADWDERFEKNVGVLVVSKAPTENVFAHLRSIFTVLNESGSVFFFRYYDPRVLRTYLPACTKEELAQVFGPIDAFIAASNRGVGYRFFSRAEDGSLSVMKTGRMVLKG